MWQLAQEQRLECPAEFQERLTYAGGVNKYDDPNFKLTWMGTETMRAGGVWENPELPTIEHFAGYRDVLADVEGEGWALRQWMPAEFWGTPAAWYAQNFDQYGYQILGGYPYSGRYMTVFPLVYKDGAKTEIMPLNSYIVDIVVPIVVMAKQISELQKRAVIEENKARKEAARVAKIEDALRNAWPALGEIRSAAGLSCLSEVQKKVEAIERYWATGVDFVRQRGRGVSVN